MDFLMTFTRDKYAYGHFTSSHKFYGDPHSAMAICIHGYSNCTDSYVRLHKTYPGFLMLRLRAGSLGRVGRWPLVTVLQVASRSLRPKPSNRTQKTNSKFKIEDQVLGTGHITEIR